MSVKGYYDQYWKDNGQVISPHSTWKKRVLLSDLKVTSTDSIFDYGCGDGEISCAFVSQCSVYGYDISDYAMDKANKRGLLSSLDYHGKFKVVLLLDVLEHLFDVDDLLISISDRTDSGGCIYISVPNGVNLYNRIQFLLGKPVDLNDKAHAHGKMWSEHVRIFTLELLHKLCARHKFKIAREWFYFPASLSEKSGILNIIIIRIVNILHLHQLIPSMFALSFMVKCIKE